jgi:alkylation response protein AidB-like acyl-CoA dehydrogenase
MSRLGQAGCDRRPNTNPLARIGGSGYDVRVHQILEGANEIVRVTISRVMLGNYRK